MKKILFLTNKYFPDYLTNSICIRNIVEELSKNDIEIHILAITGDLSSPKLEINQNIYIHRIHSKLERDYLNTVKYPYKQNKSMHHLRIRNRVVKKFIWPNYSFASYFSFLSEAKEIIKLYACNTILSCSGDFLPQIIGIKLKHENNKLKLISYFNDPLPSNNRFFKRQLTTIFRIRKWEHKLFLYADKILMEENIANHYELGKNNLDSKIIRVGIPMLIPLHYERKREIHTMPQLVFLGSLEKSNRNPEFFLNLLSMLDIKFSFKIYGLSDCIELIRKYEDIAHGQIKYMGQVSRESIDNIIEEADFLVNIGNKDISQIPSKIYEYIGSGKPIINIVKNEEDPTINILNKYKLCLNLSEKKNLDEASNFVEDFIRENMGKTVDFNDISNTFLYNTPKYTSDIILSLCE